jgi:hypothetical protein
MKTVAQWAEQLPELIRHSIKEEIKKNGESERKYKYLSHFISGEISWVRSIMGTDFYIGISILCDEYLGREEEILDGLDESVPYTKEEVEAMILEFADPNDDVCKVMLANVLANQITDKVNQLSNDLNETKTMDGFYSKMNLSKENEALKSTIEGLNAIVETQKVEIAQLKSAKDQLNWDMYPLHRQLNEAKVKLELAEKRIVELNKEINSSLFTRFLNLFK